MESLQKSQELNISGIESISYSVLSESLRLHGARQAPPSIKFSRQEYWSELPCPPPRDLPDLGNESGSLALKAVSLASEPPGKPFSGINDLILLLFSPLVVPDSL